MKCSTKLSDYLKGAIREKRLSVEKLGKPIGYSQQKLDYRINNELLTPFELKYLFTALDTPDEVILKFLKEKK